MLVSRPFWMYFTKGEKKSSAVNITPKQEHRMTGVDIILGWSLRFHTAMHMFTGSHGRFRNSGIEIMNNNQLCAWKDPWQMYINLQ